MDQLAAWLDRAKVSQADLAKRVGVTGASLSRILSRKQTPSLRVAAALERETGIPASAFVVPERAAA